MAENHDIGLRGMRVTFTGTCRVLGSLWSDLVDSLQTRRATWVREIQPGLVVADKSVASALLRMSLCLLYAFLFAGPYRQWTGVMVWNALMVTAHIVRCYCSRECPIGYARWRWLVYLSRASVFVVGTTTYHALATPAHNLTTYLKNLLVASGLCFSVMLSLLDQETFLVTFVCTTAQVTGLCYNAKRACCQGLLATEYSTAMTRSWFVQLGTFIHIMASMYRTADDRLLAVPESTDPTKDLPVCLCLVQTLLITIGFVIPNTLLFLYESFILDKAEQRRLHGLEGDPPHNDNRDTRMVWGMFASGLFQITGFTMLAASQIWAYLRHHHDV